MGAEWQIPTKRFKRRVNVHATYCRNEVAPTFILCCCFDVLCLLRGKFGKKS